MSNSVIETLAQYQNWVGFKIVKRDNGKTTKPPFNPLNGQMAKPNDPNTWGSYNQALAAVKQYGFDGIGFMFYPKTINLVGIDLDHCLDSNGQLSEFAQKVIAMVPGYWEVSPSEQGLHCFVLGNIPTGQRKHTKLGFEIYQEGRYFTVTGKQWPGTANELTDQTTQLYTLHKMVFSKPESPKPKREVNSKHKRGVDSHEDILNKAKNATNGAKFQTLWQGNWQGYGSQSEADLALCSMLAYWSNSDKQAIDTLFRQSGLMRDKWEESNYAESTITQAIENCQDYNNGIQNTIIAPKQNGHDPVSQYITTAPPQNIPNQNGHDPTSQPQISRIDQRATEKIAIRGRHVTNIPDLQNKDIEYLTYGEEADEDGIAHAVINWYCPKYDKEFLYTNHMGWLYWTGTHWEKEDAQFMVSQAIITTIRARRLAAMMKDYELGIKLFNVRNAMVNSTEAMLRNLCKANINDFDQSLDQLNCANGVINLRTSELIPHHYSQRFTYCVKIPYNPKADTTMWLKHFYNVFIPEHITQNNAGIDEYTDLIVYVTAMLGYSLTGRTNEEVMFYIHGKSRSGKDTLLQGVRELIGKPLSQGIPFNTLTRKREGNDQNFDMAPLRPCCFLVASETDNTSKSVINSNVVKSITSYKTLMNAAFKGKDHFTFEPKFKIWVSSNYAIQANADDEALWSRLRILESANCFLGREDTRLKDKLMSPEALEGLLRLLVEGAKHWYTFYDKGQKFPTPHLVNQSTLANRQENDTLGQFIEECCTIGENCKVIGTVFLRAYTDWCNDNGFTPKMAKSLGVSMRAKGFEYKPARYDNIEIVKKSWIGISLKSIV